MTAKHDRRRFLRAAASTAVVGAWAGCSAGSGDGGGGGGGGDATTSTTTTSASSGGDGWVEASTIEMTDELTYEPKRATVSTGTTVTWENVGGIGHTVTAYEDEIPDGAAYFASGGYDGEQAARDGYSSDQGGNVPGGETYEHTFETAGTYKYFCVPHELNGMVGYVKVT